MPSFKDSEGRTWTIDINVATLKRVRTLINVDLAQVLQGKLIDDLLADPILLVDVVYCCVKPQADERKVSDEQFGTAMAGDTIHFATNALLESIVLFCPSPKDRANLDTMLKTMEKGKEKMRDIMKIHGEKEAAEIEAQVEKMVNEIIEKQKRKPNESGN